VPLGGSKEGHPCCFFDLLKLLYPGLRTLTDFNDDINKYATDAGCVFASKLTLQILLSGGASLPRSLV
jgi:hypothetical protein